MRHCSFVLALIMLYAIVNGSEYKWYTVKQSDITQISEKGVTTTFTTKPMTSGLIIDAEITDKGCSGPESHIFVFITDAIDANLYTKWDKIRYTLEFFGSSSCWSILGNTKYGQFGNNFETGLIEFDINNKEDRIISNTLFYGQWHGQTVRCDNQNDNFWHELHDNIYSGALVVEQRRDQNAIQAGVGSGHSCSSLPYTKVRISNIEVGYYEYNCKCESETGLDIAFLLDESGSVKQNEWEIMVDWVANLIRLDINDNSYVSLVEYAETEAEFEQFLEFTKVAGNRIDIITELQNNVYNDNGGTDTSTAIISALDIINDWDNSNANNRPNMLIILTDDSTDFCTQAVIDAFNQNDVEIILIGIGPGSWSTKLNCIYPNGRNSFGVSSFSDSIFDTIQSEIRYKTCQSS